MSARTLLRPALVVALLAPCMLVAGCGSSPPSTFYALSVAGGTAQPAPYRTIKLHRPGIAGTLDRPEIVERVVGHRLRMNDTDRWAAPLDEMLGRVLAQDLEQRLSGSVVFTEDGAITADADVTVEIDVRELDVGEAGRVELRAEIAVERGDDRTPVAARVVHLEQPPNGGSTAALVAAMSDAVGMLADEVAALVRTTAARPAGADGTGHAARAR